MHRLQLVVRQQHACGQHRFLLCNARIENRLHRRARGGFLAIRCVFVAIFVLIIICPGVTGSSSRSRGIGVSQARPGGTSSSARSSPTAASSCFPIFPRGTFTSSSSSIPGLRTARGQSAGSGHARAVLSSDRLLQLLLHNMDGCLRELLLLLALFALLLDLVVSKRLYGRVHPRHPAVNTHRIQSATLGFHRHEGGGLEQADLHFLLLTAQFLQFVPIQCGVAPAL
mmetsp:Transcript_26215/g.44238  ORF Transcript_26215/g.44238 Transcript_26215/m.44238 type:complete len:227 (-) Transcript_26215:369-1049(-)